MCCVSSSDRYARLNRNTAPGRMPATGEDSVSTYRWVHHEGGKLYDVGILADGSLHNPRNYPVDVVRAAVLAADARRHERRSRSALKAAQTRKRRTQARVHQIAARIVAGHRVGPRQHCALCGRGLDDPASVARGIGSECWQDVLVEIEARRTSSAPAGRRHAHC